MTLFRFTHESICKNMPKHYSLVGAEFKVIFLLRLKSSDNLKRLTVALLQDDVQFNDVQLVTESGFPNKQPAVKQHFAGSEGSFSFGKLMVSDV